MLPSLKLKLFVFVLLPRIIIAIWLFVFAGYFLMSSETPRDIILNSVVVVFIMEADKMLYKGVLVYHALQDTIFIDEQGDLYQLHYSEDIFLPLFPSGK